MVCWSAKMAVPVKMPFGLRTRVGPRNHVLDGGLDPPWEGAILGKGWVIVKLATLQKWLNRSRCRLRYGLGPRKHVLDGGPDTPCDVAIFRGKNMPWHVCRHCRELCENGWTNWDAVWVMSLGGLKEPCIRWESRYPYVKKQFLGERTCTDMPDNSLPWNGKTLPWSVLKWLNRSRCHLGCELRCTKEACVTWGAYWCNLANTIDMSMFGWAEWSGGDVPYVKLLWPLVIIRETM